MKKSIKLRKPRVALLIVAILGTLSLVCVSRKPKGSAFQQPVNKALNYSNVVERNVEMKPVKREFYGRGIIWQFPDQEHLPEEKRSTCPIDNGVLFLYHGCNRRASSFFYSPEGREMIKAALNQGMAVVAFTKDRELGCWSEADLQPVVRAGRLWVEKQLIPFCGEDAAERIPFYGFGASSGGSFVAQVAAEVEKWSPRKGNENSGVNFRFRAINVQIMTPNVEISIPTIFTTMSRDARTRAGVHSVAQKMTLEKIPTAIQETEPKQVTPEFFKARFSSDERFSMDVANGICNGLKSMGAINGNGELVVNPRSLSLETILEKHPSRPYGVTESLWNVLDYEEQKDAASLWLIEELNVAFDAHEITSEGFAGVLSFFFQNTSHK